MIWREIPGFEICILRFVNGRLRCAQLANADIRRLWRAPTFIICPRPRDVFILHSARRFVRSAVFRSMSAGSRGKIEDRRGGAVILVENGGWARSFPRDVT